MNEEAQTVKLTIKAAAFGIDEWYWYWCGLWTGGVIGPYIYEDEQEKAISVNSRHFIVWIGSYGLEISLFPTRRRCMPHSGETIGLLHE